MADEPQADQLHHRPGRRRPATPRTYANFCSIAHTPFDFTLTFCEVHAALRKEIQRRPQPEHVVRAPVRAQVVVPVQFVPEPDRRAAGALRVFTESYANVGCRAKGPVH